jgi:hypothetical protein
MRSDIVPGTVFSDNAFPDLTTKRRKLSEIQGQDPMDLVLGPRGYRLGAEGSDFIVSPRSTIAD